MLKSLTLQEINPCMRSAGREKHTKQLGPKRIIYDYEFVYCHSGQFIVDYETHHQSVSSGEILIISPGIPHQLDYTHALEVYWVHFDFYYHDDQADLARYISLNKDKPIENYALSQDFVRPTIVIQPNRRLPNNYFVHNKDKTLNTYIKLVTLFEEKDFGWSLKCKHLIVGLLVDTLSHLTIYEEGDSSNEELSQSIKNYLKENTHRPITGEELSNHFHYHKDTLGRLFKKETGETLKQYRQKIRLKKVKSLLLETNLSLDEIANQCGYTNRSHLISNFKAKQNQTPSNYRSTPLALR